MCVTWAIFYGSQNVNELLDALSKAGLIHGGYLDGIEVLVDILAGLTAHLQWRRHRRYLNPTCSFVYVKRCRISESLATAFVLETMPPPLCIMRCLIGKQEVLPFIL